MNKQNIKDVRESYFGHGGIWTNFDFSETLLDETVGGNWPPSKSNNPRYTIPKAEKLGQDQQKHQPDDSSCNRFDPQTLAVTFTTFEKGSRVFPPFPKGCQKCQGCDVLKICGLPKPWFIVGIYIYINSQHFISFEGNFEVQDTW